MTSSASAVLLAIVTRFFGEKAGKFAKAVLPASATVVAVGAQWAATGKFDRVEMVTAATGLGAAALSFLVPNLKMSDVLDFIPTDDLTGPSVDPPPLRPEDEPIDVPEPPEVPEVPPAPSEAPTGRVVENPPSSALTGPPPIAPEAEPDPPTPPSAAGAGATAPTSQ